MHPGRAWRDTVHVIDSTGPSGFTRASTMESAKSGLLSTDVIHAIARVEGVEPMELEFLLYDFIDPGALDALARSSSGPWELDFQVGHHYVTVNSDGRIIVDGHVFD